MKRVSITLFAVLMTAAIAGANEGRGPGGPGGPGFEGGFGGGGIVASNGTIFITSTTVDMSTRTSTTTIKAITTSGTVAWTATLTNGRGLVLSDGNLLSTSETTASDGTVSSTLTAISTSSGSVAWTRSFSGRVTSLEPFSGGTYVIVVTPAATTGGTPTRSLSAVSSSGVVLWTISLT
jgi:hypothetical protein